MRTPSQHAPCASAFLFERQRAAMRQNAFARARSSCASAAVAKRKSRDDDGGSSSDDSSSGPEQLLPKRRRVVLEGFKRMRVSSPPTGTSQTSPTSSASDYMMADDDDDTPAAATRRAIVRADNAWSAGSQRCPQPPVPTKWTPAATFRYASDLELQLPPADPSCTAIVLFNAPPPTAIPRSLHPLPRVELVESDEDAGSSSSDDEQPFVRFEEIHDDDDEPMEID